MSITHFTNRRRHCARRLIFLTCSVAMATASTGCSSRHHSRGHGEGYVSGGGIAAIVVDAANVAPAATISAVGVAVAAVAVPALIVASFDGEPSNKGDGGASPDPTTVTEFTPVPMSERSPMGSYQDEVPPVTHARRVTNSNVDWRGVTVSALYVFDTGLDLYDHTGWGGVIDYSVIMRERSRNFYTRFGMDFVYFQADANIVTGGEFSRKEEIDSYRAHMNMACGGRLHDFDLGVFFGIGLGATRTSGTRYNEHSGAHTSFDAVAQLGARLTYQPTDWCSIFAGYRIMWSVPFQVIDDDDRRSARDRYPSLSAQSVEIGVTFLF